MNKTYLILMSVLLLVAAIGMASTVHSQETQPITVTVGFYGAETSSGAKGMQLAVQQIQSFGTFEDGDGVPYEMTGIVSEDLTDLQNVNMLLVTPDSPTPEQPVTLNMPIMLLSSEADLLLENIEGSVFRAMTATDQLYAMLGDYAVGISQAERVTLIGDPEVYGSFFTAYEQFLTSVDQTGNLTIQMIEADIPDLDQLEAIVENDSQVVVYRGASENAGAIIAALNASGWSGVFVFHQAFEATEAGVLSPVEGIQIVGMTPWSNAFEDKLSEAFIEAYLDATNDAPDPLAVAAYDITWALRVLVRRNGSDPQTLAAAIPETDVIQTTQGTINPPAFGGTELYRSGAIYELTDIGGINILARYNSGELVVEPPPELPTPTFAPSQTPSVPVVTAVQGVNVRSGPGLNYERIGFLEEGVTVGVLGAIPDFSWFYIQASNGTGWVKAEFVTLFNPLGGVNGIPIVPVPPTPVPTATPQIIFTPTPQGQPDLVIDAVGLNPTRLVMGQPFQATVTVRNAGTVAAGTFTVGATWNPGNIATSVSVPSLAPFTTVSAILQATLMQPGMASVQVVVDQGNTVIESNEGNNIFTLNYVVDAVPTIEASNTFGVGELNFAGAPTDINWTGASLDALNGATVGVINGIAFQDVHVGLLTSGAIVSPMVGTIAPNTVFGLRTGTGQCGVFRIDNVVGANIALTWRMYASDDCN